MDATLNLRTLFSRRSLLTTTKTSNFIPRRKSKQVICTKTTVIRDAKPCSLADTLKMEASGSSKMLVKKKIRQYTVTKPKS